MIIDCINCNKKFNVNSELIPDEGRTIQCGSCNHIWFYKKIQNKSRKSQVKEEIESLNIQEKKYDFKIDENKKTKIHTKKKGSEIIKYQSKSSFTFGNFLSYIVVFIISLIGLIILLDTFKSPLYVIFPNLEYFLFSFYETLKDIELFIRDLV